MGFLDGGGGHLFLELKNFDKAICIFTATFGLCGLKVGRLATVAVCAGIPDAVDSQRHHVLTPENVPGVAAARHRGDLASAQKKKKFFQLSLKQCFGSVTFWYGSGSLDPYL